MKYMSDVVPEVCAALKNRTREVLPFPTAPLKSKLNSSHVLIELKFDQTSKSVPPSNFAKTCTDELE